MKSIFSFIIVLISCSTIAKAGDLKESRLFRQVIVNSDVEDLTITKGKCLVKGKVFYEIETDPYSTDFILATAAVQFIYDVDGKKLVQPMCWANLRCWSMNQPNIYFLLKR